jgi:energy-coupling factor transport system ATP-binding protein
VIASHELDLFLPLADRVVLLKDCAVLGQWSPQELIADPTPLTAAGLGIPDCIRLAALAGAACASEEAIALSLAEKLEAQVLEAAASPLLPASGLGTASAPSPPPMPAAPANSVNGGSKAWFDRLSGLDPRAKWLLYALFSLSLLISPNWGVTVLGGAAVAVLAITAGIPARRWLKPVLPFAGFILIACAISGLQLSIDQNQDIPLRLGYSWEQGEVALKRLTPLLPVLGGGVLFNALTPPLSIQKGVQEVLRRIPGIRRGAETAGLAVSLLFRFIRFLPGELSRMALLASARGKPGSNPGKLKLRQLPAFFIPLILSMLHYAEELSFALNARGYGRAGIKRTNAAPLRWRRSDGAACLAGLLGIAGLNTLRLFL